MMEKRFAARLSLLGFLGISAVLAAGAAFAQQSVRVRGTVEDLSGDVLKVKSRDGADLNIKLTDDVRVTAIVKASLSDVKQGTFVGVVAAPREDGTWKAVEVQVFPEALRGIGEGDRPWDLLPKSTMTNATVAEIKTASTVAAVDGPTLTLKYKDGEKVVVVPADAPVITYATGDKSELKPGAKIIINAATKNADGSLSANRVGVGRDGLTPPM